MTSPSFYKIISRSQGKYDGLPGTSMPIRVGPITLGGSEAIFIAGPCAIETKEQLWQIAHAVKRAGAHILRGGVFKPRTSVYSFQGLGSRGWQEAQQALTWLQEVGRSVGMPTITEVRGESQVELVAQYADILQIGARNMYNQDLLVAVAKTNKPILLKRHFGAGIEEFLSYAEYVAAAQNLQIILCERGVLPVGRGKSFTRYCLDLAAVPVLQQETFLPVVVDPSHGTGRSDLVLPMSCAAIAAGASGLMIEVHTDPGSAWSDGEQAITPDELQTVIAACRRVRKALAETAPATSSVPPGPPLP